MIVGRWSFVAGAHVGDPGPAPPPPPRGWTGRSGEGTGGIAGSSGQQAGRFCVRGQRLKADETRRDTEIGRRDRRAALRSTSD